MVSTCKLPYWFNSKNATTINGIFIKSGQQLIVNNYLGEGHARLVSQVIDVLFDHQPLTEKSTGLSI
jgi:hypothetical protein